MLEKTKPPAAETHILRIGRQINDVISRKQPAELGKDLPTAQEVAGLGEMNFGVTREIFENAFANFLTDGVSRGALTGEEYETFKQRQFEERAAELKRFGERVAKLKERFKEEIDAADEEERPSDEMINSVGRVVDVIEKYCPLGISEVSFEEDGAVVDVRDDRTHYISVECRKAKGAQVYFNVMSHVSYEDVSHAANDSFLQGLLGTMRHR